MGQRVCQIRQEVTSPQGAYERAQTLCQTAVALQKMESVYIGESLNALTRKGDFGSWLQKLFHGKKVTIHLHYYERLVHIVEELTDKNRRQIDELDELIRDAKGRRHAFVESDSMPDLIQPRIGA